jgi:hypothetical protein
MTTTTPPPTFVRPTGSGPGWGAGRIVAAVAASLVALLGFGLALGGIALVVAHSAVRDDDGFYTSPTERMISPTAAITADDLKFGDPDTGGADAFIDELTGVIRIRATATDGTPVFVGVAREGDVDAYLGAVARDAFDDIVDGDVRFDRRTGPLRGVEPPADADIWVTSATGPGTQSIRWDPGSGNFAAVIMRADGRPGVDVRASVGARVGWILGVGIGLIVAGALMLFGGAVGLALAIRGRPRSSGGAPQPQQGEAEGGAAPGQGAP